MELNSTIKDRLDNLLADPALAGPGDEAMLTQLADSFPYFKPLHLLIARVAQNKENIEKAALYSNGQLCYNILHAETFASNRATHNTQPATEEVAEEVAMAVEDSDPATHNTQPATEKVAGEEVTVEDPEPATHNTQPATEKVAGEEVTVEDPEPATHNTQPATEEETFEEISEFNHTEFVQDPNTQYALRNTEEVSAEATASEGVAGEEVAVEDPEPATHNSQPTTHNPQPATKEDIIHWELEDKQVKIAAAPEIETVIPDEPEHAPLSKYDDDKLPYTFLWWLAKTRAEHQQIFQPYAAPKKEVSGALQQQYVEHIFHLQTGLLDNNGLPDAGTENIRPHKEDELIEAFLQNEPQIKPPPVDKLDNENKARKSAEDHNDVVSETLATIYIEQMLYRKAIDTYEKLSLKFPEKSRYFADLIKSLEKKI